MKIRPLREMKLRYIERAIRYFGGNRTQTALALGISIRGLRNIIKEYGLGGTAGIKK